MIRAAVVLGASVVAVQADEVDGKPEVVHPDSFCTHCSLAPTVRSPSPFWGTACSEM